MKKKIRFMLFVLLITFLTACSANEEEGKGNNATELEQTDEKALNVDKGLLNVEVTLPASFFEGEDVDTVISKAEEEGIKVTKNDDGSISYKMSKTKHKEMMTEMGTAIDEGIDAIKTSGDYSSIKDITHNKDFTEFTLIVDKAAFENSFDGFAVLGLGIQGSMYQLFNGANQDDYKVTIFTKDETNQEVFNEVIYPDAFEESEEEQSAE